MKKTLLILSISSISLITFAKGNQVKNANKQHSQTSSQDFSTLNNDRVVVPYNTNNEHFLKSNKTSESFDELKGTVIGTTTYDLQTNSSTPGRLAITSDGKIAATWTGSTSTNSQTLDRGTFYNFYDGTSWGTAPTTRIETGIRTGWPANIIIEGSSPKEFFVSHDPANQIGDTLLAYSRNTIGSGTWTQVSMNRQLNGIWPRAVVGNGDTIHVVNSNFCGQVSTNDPTPLCDGLTQYWRSPDGGITWDSGIILPGIDTMDAGYTILSGDIYAIDAKDSVVAIAMGNSFNHFAVWISHNSGTDWERTPIVTWSDTLSETDTMYISDGSVEVLIDDNNQVHVWSGAKAGFYGTSEGQTGRFTFNPLFASGIIYWNESMGPDTVVPIAGILDIDSSGDNSGIGLYPTQRPTQTSPFTTGYGSTGIVTMPSVTIADNGDMYLVYAAQVENTDYADQPELLDARSAYDLFGTYSTDGGANWSLSVNLTNSAEEQYINVFPSVTRNAYNNKVHVMWQRDDETYGHAQDNDPRNTPTYVVNEIVYHAFDFADFQPADPIADFRIEYLGYGGEIELVDSSRNNPTMWRWDFGDGETETDQDPGDHEYDENNTYNVCLTVSNSYTDLVTLQSHVGANTTCKTIEIVKVGIESALGSSIKAFPNPAKDELIVRVGNLNNADVNLRLHDVFGATVDGYSNIPSSGNSIKLNISNLSSGIYFLEVEHKGEIATKKITVF